MRRVVYTADDEEPKCGWCDNFADGDAICEHCGPAFGWAGYTREEFVEEQSL